MEVITGFPATDIGHGHHYAYRLGYVGEPIDMGGCLAEEQPRKGIPSPHDPGPLKPINASEPKTPRPDIPTLPPKNDSNSDDCSDKSVQKFGDDDPPTPKPTAPDPDDDDEDDEDDSLEKPVPCGTEPDSRPDAPQPAAPSDGDDPEDSLSLTLHPGPDYPDSPDTTGQPEPQPQPERPPSPDTDPEDASPLSRVSESRKKKALPVRKLDVVPIPAGDPKTDGPQPGSPKPDSPLPDPNADPKKPEAPQGPNLEGLPLGHDMVRSESCTPESEMSHREGLEKRYGVVFPDTVSAPADYGLHGDHTASVKTGSSCKPGYELGEPAPGGDPNVPKPKPIIVRDPPLKPKPQRNDSLIVKLPVPQPPPSPPPQPRPGPIPPRPDPNQPTPPPSPPRTR
ncbi:hypothetical protein B0T16DRAFT_389632 [Cercophora newfieldiana]|uniref:Uncharacterized protein n=1 Tax=Cercophora newfieldiana TaxID=92897 RepID=A0AA40CUC9_9PEZI|nr:hypothetical protein B0T16DRAFT_389632 [Cercophora newfieldiana]